MEKVVKQIRAVAEEVNSRMLRGVKPTMNVPVRSLGNVSYRAKDGFFRLKGAEIERTLTVNTVKTFAQTLRMMSLSKMHVEQGKHSSKREAYYISKNWSDARFIEQDESDAIMDDVEAMLRVNREQLNFRADEHGGSVAGELVVLDRDRKTGKKLEIDCSRFGSGSYTVPSVVEQLEFRTKAKFILAIETNGTFERLVEEGYAAKSHCILVAMGGVPSRACRRFVRRLADQYKLPVYVFTDGDPYGYFNIYRTLKVGSGNAAHLNEFFCVPQARYLGRDSVGHRGVQPEGLHASAPGGGHQARAGRAEERPVRPASQGMAGCDPADAQDGQARRAAGVRQARARLRRHEISAGEAEESGEVPAVTEPGSTGSEDTAAHAKPQSSCGKLPPQQYVQKTSRKATMPAVPGSVAAAQSRSSATNQERKAHEYAGK